MRGIHPHLHDAFDLRGDAPACHEEVVSASASCGFLDAEGIATERNPAAAHMQDESTDDEISGASDYGTLA